MKLLIYVIVQLVVSQYKYINLKVDNSLNIVKKNCTCNNCGLSCNASQGFIYSDSSVF
jgi:hypothetical protein